MQDARKSRILPLYLAPVTGGITVYKKNRTRKLTVKDFNQPMGLRLNPENNWVKKAERFLWEEIETCYATLFPRESRNGKSHDYDIVEGPMANDTIYNYVQGYLDGKYSREIFWSLARFKNPTHQISFHTKEALQTLRFIGEETVCRFKL